MPHVFILRVQDRNFDAHRVCRQTLPRSGGFSERRWSVSIDDANVKQLGIVNIGIDEEPVGRIANTPAQRFEVMSVRFERVLPLSVVFPGFAANLLQASPHAVREVLCFQIDRIAA